MYICVTHVDSITKIPCTLAPMSNGPAFPEVKGLVIHWANQTEWPTNTPLFYGTCDDDADTTTPGIIKVLTEQQYTSMQTTETDLKIYQVRSERDHKLRIDVDTVNPIRWELLTEEEKQALRDYRTALLNVPEQAGFPWNVLWPTKPELPNAQVQVS